MVFFRFVILMLILSAVQAQIDSTIPPDEDEEQEDSSMHIPKFISESQNIEAKEGHTVTLPCEVDDLGPFSIVWKKGKTHIFADSIRLMNDRNFVRLDNNSLQIRKIRAEYTDDYICVISHTPVLELTHHLTVLVRPRIQLLPKNSIIVKQGVNVDVTCNVTGSPKATVTWKRVDGTVHHGHVLRISSVDRTDSGAYECKADNGVGEPAVSFFKLQVMHIPEIELKANWVYSGIGRTVDLECTVYAEPQAIVTWHGGDGKTIKSGQQFQIKSYDKNQHSLRIRKLAKDDFGKYSCMATNSEGSSSAIIEISGLASPAIFKSDPNGDKPNSFTLTWETNSYGKVIEYELKFTMEEEDSDKPPVWTEVTIPADSQTGVLHTHTYEVTDLREATTYKAIMVVRNEFGWSIPSDEFLFSTHGKAVVPPLLEESSVMSAEQGEEHSSTPVEVTVHSSTVIIGSTDRPTTVGMEEKIRPVHKEAHPDHRQGDKGNSADSPKKVRVFSLLTIIILSFFF